MSVLQGGKFGHGFAAASFTQAFARSIDGIKGDQYSALRVAIAATIGGTASVLSGGKFANGAVTSAFSRLFNGELHKQKGQTFRERAAIYRGMQERLTAEGIDTVWFGVAADLNEFFAGRAYLLGSAYDYMNDLGISLLDHNTNMFNALMTGDVNLSGQALDNFLVQGEQMHVQSFTMSRYSNGVPGYIVLPVNAAFTVGRFSLPANMQAGVGHVENMYKQNFNFWDTSHRITLGESMMSIARHGM